MAGPALRPSQSKSATVAGHQIPIGPAAFPHPTRPGVRKAGPQLGRQRKIPGISRSSWRLGGCVLVVGHPSVFFAASEHGAVDR